MTPDIQAWTDPSFLHITPTTERGEVWCWDHINAEPSPAGDWLAEHRYGPDILLAAHRAGLTVELDGRVADVPRFTPCASCPDGGVCATLGECFTEAECGGEG